MRKLLCSVGLHSMGRWDRRVPGDNQIRHCPHCGRTWRLTLVDFGRVKAWLADNAGAACLLLVSGAGFGAALAIALTGAFA